MFRGLFQPSGIASLNFIPQRRVENDDRPDGSDGASNKADDPDDGESGGIPPHSTVIL